VLPPGLGDRVRPATLAQERVLPLLPALADLLGVAGLRRGTTVAVAGSASLALALAAGASAEGSWVAAVGLPGIGAVAAAELGIRLPRFALVPDPPPRLWAATVAALVDGFDVVLVRPPARLRPADVRRLATRVRERDAVLVPVLPADGAATAWPEAPSLQLTLTAGAWIGPGAGDGHLRARLVEVAVSGRGAAARERTGHLWLPAPDGTVATFTTEARPAPWPGTELIPDEAPGPGRSRLAAVPPPAVSGTRAG
jgi:hypothetical protein